MYTRITRFNGDLHRNCTNTGQKENVEKFQSLHYLLTTRKRCTNENMKLSQNL